MTVGFLINTCEPFYRGGYERRAWTFARELARQGHDVRIYTSCSRDETVEGVRFVRLAAPQPYFNSRGVRNGLADVLFTLCVLKLLWKLRKGELEVLDVCATPFLHLPFAAFVARLKGISPVLTCHEALLSSLPEYVRERGHGSGLTAWLLEKILAAIYSLGMKSIPHRIAVSQRTADGLVGENLPAQATVEFGLEPEAFSAERPKSIIAPVRFVYCGRLTPIKAVDQAITTLLSLREEGVPFRFDVIGEGSEAAKLRAIVDSADARGVINFHGAISDQDKRVILAESEVFILTSPREGFSIATLEAMAQGCCAVIVNDPPYTNGAMDFVRPEIEGLCLAPGLEAMRAGLRRLLHDSSLRLQLRQAAWTSANNFRIEAQAKRLVAYYDRQKP